MSEIYSSMHIISLLPPVLLTLLLTLPLSLTQEPPQPTWTLYTNKFTLKHLDHGAILPSQDFQIFDNTSTVSVATCKFPAITSLTDNPIPAMDVYQVCSPKSYQWRFIVSNYGASYSAKNFVMKFQHTIQLKDKQKTTKVREGTINLTCATPGSEDKCSADMREIGCVEVNPPASGWTGDMLL